MSQDINDSELLVLAVAAIEGIKESICIPSSNCSCHIFPPCNDCVEYAGIREALVFAMKTVDDIHKVLTERTGNIGKEIK